MLSRKGLAISLSRLATFDEADVRLEQYATESEIAADLLWDAHLRGLDGTSVIDLGAGTGILGIGAALMGARVTLVEKDERAIEIMRVNIAAARLGDETRIVHADINAFRERADLVVMNPPFGTRLAHADRDFLRVAFSCAPVVYSLHKTSTEGFVRAFARDNGFTITYSKHYRFPLRATMRHHTKRREFVDVTLYRFEKKAYEEFPEQSENKTR